MWRVAGLIVLQALVAPSLHAGDGRWWVRHHAVTVLEQLIRDPRTPWHGDANQDTDHYRRLARSVDRHRTEVLLLLSDLVADEDEWVRGVAERTLAYLETEGGRR